MTAASMNAANGQQASSKNGIGMRKRKQDAPIIVDRLFPQGREDLFDNLFLRNVAWTNPEMDDVLRSNGTNFAEINAVPSVSSPLSDEKLHVDSARDGALDIIPASKVEYRI